uniref:Uncharacterized protein n=1 Tax=Arundo donax TaxID=35708 RepID=A0A0A9FLC1_ARUDO
MEQQKNDQDKNKMKTKKRVLTTKLQNLPRLIHSTQITHGSFLLI